MQIYAELIQASELVVTSSELAAETGEGTEASVQLCCKVQTSGYKTLQWPEIGRSAS